MYNLIVTMLVIIPQQLSTGPMVTTTQINGIKDNKTCELLAKTIIKEANNLDKRTLGNTDWSCDKQLDFPLTSMKEAQ